MLFKQKPNNDFTHAVRIERPPAYIIGWWIILFSPNEY